MPADIQNRKLLVTVSLGMLWLIALIGGVVIWWLGYQTGIHEVVRQIRSH